MKLTSTTTRALLVMVALPTLMASKCEEPLVADSGFDLWCGDSLCKWQVDAGLIQPVPTWNARDLGVELVGDDVRLSQTVAATSRDVSCLHFNLLANIDEPVMVVLEVTFDDDPAPDRSETLPNGAWTPVKYRLTTPTYFHSMRLVIHKTGAGRAVLAQIQALSSSDCSDAPPLAPLARPAGAACEADAQCASGTTCRPRGMLERASAEPSAPASASLCEACARDVDCPSPTVCGLAFAAGIDDPFAACVLPSAASLGDRCRGDTECNSGICCNGSCSTCCAGRAGACAAGQACAEAARDTHGLPERVAWQCAPHAGLGLPSSACLVDGDCASGRCTGQGPRSICIADGRRCGSNLDCLPPPDWNSCTASGVAGGRCD